MNWPRNFAYRSLVRDSTRPLLRVCAGFELTPICMRNSGFCKKWVAGIEPAPNGGLECNDTALHVTPWCNLWQVVYVFIIWFVYNLKNRPLGKSVIQNRYEGYFWNSCIGWKLYTGQIWKIDHWANLWFKPSCQLTAEFRLQVAGSRLASATFKGVCGIRTRADFYENFRFLQKVSSGNWTCAEWRIRVSRYRVTRYAMM